MADANSPLVIVPRLSAIAIKYRQKNFIADRVVPRTPVDLQTFIHIKDRMADWITPIETTVGRTGKVNQLANSAQDPVTLSTLNQGLDEGVPNQDAMNGPSESALDRATQRVMALVELRREQRVAAFFASGTAATFFDFYTTLSGTSKWSDIVSGVSNPVSDLLAYLDKPFMRPNKLVMGRDVWTKLRQHPKMIEAAFWGGAQAGIVGRAQVADILEVDEIIVGDGWYNSAVKGLTPVNARLWGNFVAGIYQGDNVTEDSGNAWGFTAQFGQRIAGTITTADIGLFGGQWVRAGESVREVIAAKEFGFLISAPI